MLGKLNMSNANWVQIYAQITTIPLDKSMGCYKNRSYVCGIIGVILVLFNRLHLTSLTSNHKLYFCS